jgi:hypothetical protein
MDTVGIYLLYLLISIGLTIAVGTGVARSGRAFLLDVFSGDDTLARAVSRLIVLGFYLLSFGFVALAMRTGGDVTSARDGLQLLSVKVGEVLLVLGALHLLTLAALIRARRLAQSRMTQPRSRPAALHGGPARPAPRAVGDDLSAAEPARPAPRAVGDDLSAADCDPATAPLAESVLQ